jgi:hypothetical protein
MRQEMITNIIPAGKFVLTLGGAASDIARIWGVASHYPDLYHPMCATSGFHGAECKHRCATMAVELLPKLGLPAMEYDTALYVALQAAQKIAMAGNDSELTEGPDGKRFPGNLETAAHDEASRAARECSREQVLKRKAAKEAKKASSRQLRRKLRRRRSSRRQLRRSKRW